MEYDYSLKAQSKQFTTKLLKSNYFVTSLWNISSAVEYNEPGTNNTSEEGNNALNSAFSSTNPTI